MKKRTVIIALLFITSLFVVYKFSDQRGYERCDANKVQEVQQSYQRGFQDSENSIEPLVINAHRQGIEQGRAEKEAEISGCTVAMAHQGKCHLPCGSYFDCVAKNGHPEREY